MIGSNPALKIGSHHRFTLSCEMRDKRTVTVVNPRFVTYLALIGWIGMLLPFAYMRSYQSIYGNALLYALFYLPEFWRLMLIWVVTGATLVVLDYFRAKTVVEWIIWSIGLLLWTVAIFTALVRNVSQWPEWLYRTEPGFIDLMIVDFVGDLVVLDFFIVLVLLLPLHVMRLSFLAIRAWLLILRRR